MFLHKSVSQYTNDRKLKLLEKGIITFSQFINLLDKNDPYILVGPAIVDKKSVSQFLSEWKDNVKDVTSVRNPQAKATITVDEIIQKLDVIEYNFEEARALIADFRKRLEEAKCKSCTKNRYVMSIAKIVNEHFVDGREYSDSDYDFISRIVERYFPSNNSIMLESQQDFDIEWIQPDIIRGLGTDLIDGLTSCFECTKKHISRAKILWEEMNQKYPEHGPLCFNELAKANKAIEEAFTLYWDSLGNLDQASCELIGGNDFTDLPSGYQIDMIELANMIRIQRINFQENIAVVPEWNKLRIEVQRLENKIMRNQKNEA